MGERESERERASPPQLLTKPTGPQTLARRAGVDEERLGRLATPKDKVRANTHSLSLSPPTGLLQVAGPLISVWTHFKLVRAQMLQEWVMQERRRLADEDPAARECTFAPVINR